MSREVRLLLVTTLVSVALLFLLARYRFPAPTRSVQSVPVAPLERLAARATFEELASILTGLEPFIRRAVVAFRVVPAGEGKDERDQTNQTRIIPGLRVRDDIAVAARPAGSRIIGLIGDEAAVPSIVGQDLVRGLVAVRIPASPAPTVSIQSEPIAGANQRYVAAIEGTMGGPILRPVFLGHADPISDASWPVRLLAVSGSPGMSMGSLVFALDGHFVGLVVMEEGLPVLVPAPALLEAADPLVRGGSVAPATVNVVVQPFTPAIGRATKAADGAVVSFVEPGRPADRKLRVGDVIVRIGNRKVVSTEDFHRAEAALQPGAPARFEVIRGGSRQTVDITPATAGQFPSGGDGTLGLTLRAVPDRGAQVTRVVSGSSAGAGGLNAGDVVTQVNDVAAPTPAQVRAAWEALPSGAAMLIGVRRNGEHRVVVLDKP